MQLRAATLLSGEMYSSTPHKVWTTHAKMRWWLTLWYVSLGQGRHSRFLFLESGVMYSPALHVGCAPCASTTGTGVGGDGVGGGIIMTEGSSLRSSKSFRPSSMLFVASTTFGTALAAAASAAACFAAAAFTAKAAAAAAAAAWTDFSCAAAFFAAACSASLSGWAAAFGELKTTKF